MNDLISRQAAIDALQDRYKLYSWDDGGAQKAEIGRIIREIYDMPSVQPEKRTEERTETHSCDLISRQDAIDAVESMLRRKFGIGGDLAEITLAELPSAQPEMIREIRKWINSGNRGNADYFIVDKIEEIINKYE